MGRRALGVALAATFYALAGPGAAAWAQPVPTLVTYPLAADIDVDGPSGRNLISVDLALRTGESRRLIGQVHAIMASQGVGTIDDSVGIHCVDLATGAQAGISAWAEVSLLSDVPSTLRPSLLFTAPRDGTYRCSLLAVVSGGSVATVMTVHRDTTYLAVSATDEIGSHFWVNPPCDPAGALTTCTYLGPNEATQWIQVFYNDQTPLPLYKWKAADSATHATFTANLELTTCGHTASCNGRRNDFDSSTVTSRLEVAQLDAHGQDCNVTASAWRTDVIGILPHNGNIPYNLTDVPVQPTCGSRNFYVRVYVQWVSGNPVKIVGFDPDGQVSMTNAFAVNSHYAPTTTVPNVIGLTPEGAKTPLEAVQLRVGAVKNASSFSPAGIIVAQLATAGTVEPIHSLVDLYVSLGVEYFSGYATAAKPSTALAMAESRAWARATGAGHPRVECHDDGNSHADLNESGTYDAVFTLVCRLVR
jgi:PASTA domain-containing protein